MTQEEPTPTPENIGDAQVGRGLSLNALGLLAVVLVLGGIASRSVNVALDRQRIEAEHQRHLVRVQRDLERYDSDDIAAKIAAKRAKRGLPKVESSTPGGENPAPVQAN